MKSKRLIMAWRKNGTPTGSTGVAKAEAELRFRHAGRSLQHAEGHRRAGASRARRRPPRRPSRPSRRLGQPRSTGPRPSRPRRNGYKEAKAAAEAKAPEKALSLVQYAIRLDGERAEYHALHGRLLEAVKGRQADPGAGPGDRAAAQPQGRGFHHPAGPDLPVPGHACPGQPALEGGAQPGAQPRRPSPRRWRRGPGRKGNRKTKRPWDWASSSTPWWPTPRNAINRIFKRSDHAGL